MTVDLLANVPTFRPLVNDPTKVIRLTEKVKIIPPEWDRSKFVLCGSAALAVNGIRDVHDLDILVTPDMWPAVKEQFPQQTNVPVEQTDEEYEDAQAADGQPSDVLYRVEGIDFFDTLLRKVATPAQVFRHATPWNGYNVLSIRHCLAVKMLGFRGKDKHDALLYLAIEAADRMLIEDLLPIMLHNIHKLDDQQVDTLATAINARRAAWVV